MEEGPAVGAAVAAVVGAEEAEGTEEDIMGDMASAAVTDPITEEAAAVTIGAEAGAEEEDSNVVDMEDNVVVALVEEVEEVGVKATHALRCIALIARQFLCRRRRP